MKIPPHIARNIKKAGGLNGAKCGEDGEVRWDQGRGLYPLPGFVPWWFFHEDSFGYYWPLGRETGDPVVCFINDEHYGLLPIASSMEAFLKMHYASSGVDWNDDPDDAEEMDLWGARAMECARDFELDLQGVQKLPATLKEIEYWHASSPEDLLPLDPRSPHLLLLSARQILGEGDLTGAEANVRRALDVLPEYCAATFALIQILRRQARTRESIDAMLEFLTSPGVFGGWQGYDTCLGWLQRMRDKEYPECDDPYWLRRNEISLTTGVKRNDTFLVYYEIIDAYRAQGRHLRAVKMRIRTNELFSGETVSFRDRYGWTEGRFLAGLREDFDLAGIRGRPPQPQ